MLTVASTAEAQYTTLYLLVYAQPNIAFAVWLLAKHVGIAGNGHWKVVQRMLCYLFKSEHHALYFSERKGDSNLYVFDGANWPGDSESRTPTSDYSVMM